jgi:predicted Rossmann fold nucleotide-binding protein DprA/Smf involved in DNA uptake
MGILSSRDLNPGALLAARSLLSELADLPLTFIGGWHSPAEEELLRLLSPKHSVVVCLAKGLPHYEPPEVIRAMLTEERALVLSHCSDSVRRMSRRRALRRNEIVVSLSGCVLVLTAQPGTATATLVERMLAVRHPVAAVDHLSNEPLFALGAAPATREFVQTHCLE